MLAKIGHLSAGIIPEPAEVINPAVGVVRPHRRRPEHHVPVETRWRGLIRGIAEPGHRISKVIALDGNDLSQLSLLDELAGTGELRAGPVLGPDLDHALVTTSH